MKNVLLVLTAIVLFMVTPQVSWEAAAVTTVLTEPASLTLKSTEASSGLHGASYLNPTGLEMIKDHR